MNSLGTDRALLWAAAKPYLLWIAGVVALLLLVVGAIVAPGGLADDARHARFAPFFGTAAQVIAALFVVVAVEARYVMADVKVAVATTGYIAIGLLAAVAAGSPSLPSCGYDIALALTLAGGGGGLTSALLITAEAITKNIEEQRERNRAEARKKLS